MRLKDPLGKVFFDFFFRVYPKLIKVNAHGGITTTHYTVTLYRLSCDAFREQSSGTP
jgi:hypothetical protein